MSNISNFFRYLSLTAALLLGLTACGGGGESAIDNLPAPTAGSPATGTVALLFTDAPSDEFAEVNIDVSRVQLMAEERSVTLFSGDKTVNLLDLEHHADLLSWAGDVPVGTYHRIRLTVTDVELVRKDSSGDVVEVIHPKLPGNGKLDLNPRSPFEVQPDATLMVQIDMDAKKSIHVAKTGNGSYQFRPVVFVDVLGADVEGKLVRLSGDVRDVDALAQTFQLCHERLTLRRSVSDGDVDDVNVVADDKDKDKDIDVETVDQLEQTTTTAVRCVTVQVDEQTALFDAAGEDAAFVDLMENQAATVIGRFALAQAEESKRVFSALVVELGAQGSFTRLKGTVLDSVDSTGQFTLELAEGQGYAVGTTLQVVMGTGTQLFSRFGEPLTVQSLVVGAEVKVEGVVVLSDSEPDRIKAALVFVATEQPIEKLTGTVSTVQAQGGAFTLIDSELGDRCISVTEQTDLYLISSTATGYASEAIALEQLVDAQAVEVYGRYALNGCFVAQDILAATAQDAI